MDVRTWASGQLANILEVDLGSDTLEYMLSFDSASDLEEYILDLDSSIKVTCCECEVTF
jgi:hypothetical protein